MDNIECEGFTFISNFDSANLARVELVPKKENVASTSDKSKATEEIPDFEFNIWTKPDCAGTEFENFNRTWFYFGIKGGAPFSLVKLNIVNLNKQSKMYSQGMAPVFRMVPGRSHWDRIKDKPSFSMEDNVFILSFKYRTLENLRAITYFAFTFPYSYTELQNTLNNLDVRFNATPVGSSLDEIYYHRECVCHSLEGRRIDLITISSHHGISSGREPRLKCLFADENVLRPFNFHGKKVVFVSARVHPGETPSSFVFNGFLNLLVTRDDPIAILLRKLYVFKLIPMLNPDGVANGHYRTDTRGVNLNRLYLEPSRTLHPSVFAARALLCLYHHGRELDFDEKSECDVSTLETVTGQQLISNDSVAPMVVECDTSVEKCPHDEEDAAKSNVNRVTNIENQVSVLTLNDKDTDSQSLHTASDVYTAIRETLIKNVLNACKLSDGIRNEVITAIGEGLPDKSLVFEAPPNAHCSTQKDVTTSEQETLPFSMFDISSHCLDASLAKKDSKDSDEGSIAKSNSTQKNKRAISVVSYGNVVTDPEDSGLFLYLDLHGHASKKGIFMYGNHFENADDSVECMLLPRIMALNSQNFHFTACNFTERNMYLRDRRDGMSREGSGRVAVLKTTGLVRSYTLECNYNTGRLVNVLPPCVRDSGKQPPPSVLVPPKYCPAVFEEVGKALGVSILDLTGSNPYSRIPNSEFRTLTGMRDWLRQNCLPEQVYIHKMIQREKQVKRQESSAQIAGGPLQGASSPSVIRPRARRITPAGVDSKTPVKSELAENSDRKENLSTFQVALGPQSPPVVKGSKSCTESNENVGPSCSQRCVVTKVKGASISVSGVLKQVLAVRTKCSVVGALTSGSKGKNVLLGTQTQRTTGLVREVVQKKVVQQGTAGNRLTKFRKMSGGEKHSKMNVGLCAFPESGPVLLPIGKKKLLNLTSQRKSSSDQVIAKGPKRMKITPAKLEQACSSGLVTEPKHYFQTKALSELKKLKGKGKKGKKTIAKYNPEEISIDKIPNESDIKEESVVSRPTWCLNQEGTILTATTSRRNLVVSKSKLSMRKTVGQGNLAKCAPRTRSPKLESQESSSSSTHSIKISEKHGKSRVPHSAPLKGLQKSSSFVKRKSAELVKKRGKVSMRTLATSVSKFRATTIDQTQPGTSDKKRKKAKPKFS